ncbi:hypothetical protein [Chromobacterium piscinae]|uniref:Uncharacterized protein n=1 Tax=Chromobacterium piscinae TaxID=686831 RepID=A0ABV0H3T5_9NEIS|nr:hypothetical protein [Chromobacterium piscinae]MBX9346138.1 hypothetical protein [Chromobacterium vaccinii]MCD4503065.1 hypothetical protein [Chromobacterium piscinae]
MEGLQHAVLSGSLIVKKKYEQLIPQEAKRQYLQNAKQHIATQQADRKNQTKKSSPLTLAHLPSHHYQAMGPNKS